MALISIDDRDVFNYFSQAPVTSDEMLKQWLMELKANNPTVDIITLGEGRYRMGLPLIECTGLDVNTRFNIPHMHQLISIGIKHTDSGDANSADSLGYSISKRYYPNLWALLLNIDDSTASDILDEYIDYYMELGEYLITSNSTNTDRLYINVLIRITGV